MWTSALVTIPESWVVPRAGEILDKFSGDCSLVVVRTSEVGLHVLWLMTG